MLISTWRHVLSWSVGETCPLNMPSISLAKPLCWICQIILCVHKVDFTKTSLNACLLTTNIILLKFYFIRNDIPHHIKQKCRGTLCLAAQKTKSTIQFRILPHVVYTHLVLMPLRKAWIQIFLCFLPFLQMVSPKTELAHRVRTSVETTYIYLISNTLRKGMNPIFLGCRIAVCYDKMSVQ